ncbi:hypothetical protein ACFL1C_02950 [Pseudomonadota bacterium]
MQKRLKQTIRKLAGAERIRQDMDELKMLSGAILAKELKQRKSVRTLSETEFKVFSQWGDDGIIQYLVQHLDIANRTFIEFGVADYWESNSRFLLMNDNWSGLIFDGSAENISAIKNSYYYWRYDLSAKACFVDRDNINGLMTESGFGSDVGLLHIDIDGNDYWIWKAIDVIDPLIVIVEYNSVFGPDRKITIPYQADFQRSVAHYSHLYFGTSLGALLHLAEEKNYRFVGCNGAGNNAYFVRADVLDHELSAIAARAGFQASKYRESRDANGELDYQRGAERLAVIEGLPVYNVETDQIETL